MSLDTADTILHRPTGECHIVACRHDEYLYTMGHPSKNLLVESCELVNRASDAERLASLQAMAAVQSNQHRPVCARARLAEMATAYDGGGC